MNAAISSHVSLFFFFEVKGDDFPGFQQIFYYSYGKSEKMARGVKGWEMITKQMRKTNHQRRLCLPEIFYEMQSKLFSPSPLCLHKCSARVHK